MYWGHQDQAAGFPDFGIYELHTILKLYTLFFLATPLAPGTGLELVFPELNLLSYHPFPGGSLEQPFE
jgi:hypothetical protein